MIVVDHVPEIENDMLRLTESDTDPVLELLLLEIEALTVTVGAKVIEYVIECD